MTTTIADYAARIKNARIDICRGDNPDVVSIADLAQFVTFDPADAVKMDTAPWCVAFDKLTNEYSKFEMTGGEQDYYDGFYANFADGSTLRFYAN